MKKTLLLAGAASLMLTANLAMAQLRRLPQGTPPPVVLKFDASSLPVCLVTLKGQGLNETDLHDLGQFNVRNQIANVPGASVPQPFGGKYRQIMVYVDPLKLEAHQLSPMDVVRQVNESNLILPAGDVKIGPFDYNLYSNAQAPSAKAINTMPLKTVGQSSVMVADIGMPGRDGYDLIRTVRARHDGVGRIPAIAFTAFAGPDDARRALEAGYNVHFAKPVEPVTLTRALAVLAGRGRPL